MATTSSCRNGVKLLADYVAFTGRGVVGRRLEEWHAGARWLGLCVVYGVTVLLMLALQRHHEQRWREVADVLEELTTTWYFGAALIALWLLSRVLQNNVLLALAGLAIWPDPLWFRCWRKTKSYMILRLNIAYAADPVVAAITSSGHKLPQTICKLASFK